jgi:hypothetical protein
MSWLALCGCDKVPFWVDPRNQQTAELVGVILLTATGAALLLLGVAWRRRKRDYDNGPQA